MLKNSSLSASSSSLTMATTGMKNNGNSSKQRDAGESKAIENDNQQVKKVEAKSKDEQGESTSRKRKEKEKNANDAYNNTLNDLINAGIINMRQRNLLQDSFTNGNADPKVIEAFSKYETTKDMSLIVDLMKQGVFNVRKSSIDLLGDLGDMNLDMIINDIPKELGISNSAMSDDLYYYVDQNTNNNEESSITFSPIHGPAKRSNVLQTRPRMISASSLSTIDQFSPERHGSSIESSSSKRTKIEKSVSSSSQSSNISKEKVALSTASLRSHSNSISERDTASQASHSSGTMYIPLEVSDSQGFDNQLHPSSSQSSFNLESTRFRCNSLALDPSILNSPSFKAQLFSEDNDGLFSLNNSTSSKQNAQYQPSSLSSLSQLAPSTRSERRKAAATALSTTIAASRSVRERVPRSLRERVEKESDETRKSAMKVYSLKPRIKKEPEANEDEDEEDDDDYIGSGTGRQRHSKRPRSPKQQSGSHERSEKRPSTKGTVLSKLRSEVAGSGNDSSSSSGSSSDRQGNSDSLQTVNQNGKGRIQALQTRLKGQNELFINGTIVVALSENVKGPGYVGLYSPDARKIRIEAYVARRKSQAYKKKVKYRIR